MIPTEPTTDTIAKSSTKQLTKRQKVKHHLLSGQSITGADMFHLYGIKCHKDVIYHLRKSGLDISSVSEPHSDGKHNRWFMTSDAIQAYTNQPEGA